MTVGGYDLIPIMWIVVGVSNAASAYLSEEDFKRPFVQAIGCFCLSILFVRGHESIATVLGIMLMTVAVTLDILEKRNRE